MGLRMVRALASNWLGVSSVLRSKRCLGSLYGDVIRRSLCSAAVSWAWPNWSWRDAAAWNLRASKSVVIRVWSYRDGDWDVGFGLSTPKTGWPISTGAIGSLFFLFFSFLFFSLFLSLGVYFLGGLGLGVR